MERCYRIVRYFKDGRRRTIKTGLSEAECQEHCGCDDTRGVGWFDGYDYMKGVLPKDEHEESEVE